MLTVPIPNLPGSVAEKALESLSSQPPSGGRTDLNSFPFSSKPRWFVVLKIPYFELVEGTSTRLGLIETI
jgi:hypothetical protein